MTVITLLLVAALALPATSLISHPHIRKSLYIRPLIRDDSFGQHKICFATSETSGMVEPTPPEKPRRRLQILALAFMVVQNSLMIILMRFSRVRKVQADNYITSTAVVCSELFKFAVCAVCYQWDKRPSTKVLRKEWGTQRESVIEEIFGNREEFMQVLVPSLLYVIQNNLQFVATSNLPAEVYQVLSQMKLITTALFSVQFLKRKQSIGQWMSIFVLFLGVGTVQTSFSKSAASAVFHPFIGFSSIAGYCLTSGLAGVYNEMIVKRKKAPPLVVTNLQMTSISIILALVGCLANSSRIMTEGFFKGYDWLVLAVIMLQGLGGLLTSVVVKFTNSIVKGFAVSGSIVMSCLMSAIFMSDVQMNSQFLAGTAVVLFSTAGYSFVSLRKVNTNTPKITEDMSIASIAIVDGVDDIVDNAPDSS